MRASPSGSDDADGWASRAERLLRGDRDDREAMTAAVRLLERALRLGPSFGGIGSAPSRLAEGLVTSGMFDGVCPDLPQGRRIARVNNLGLAYRLLGRLDNDPALRNAAVAARRLSLRLAAGGAVGADGRSNERVRHASVSLAEELRIRWEHQRTGADLEEAIGLCREVAELDKTLEPANRGGDRFDAAAGKALATLCTLLRLRYESTSDQLSLSQSVRVGRRAVEFADPGSNAWRSRHNNLAIALHDRWLLHRALSDADGAVEAATLAVDETRVQTSADAARWGTLGAALRSRFIHRVGLSAFHPPDPVDLRSVRPPPDVPREDVDRAVEAFGRAVDLSGGADVDVRRARLTAALLTRYDTFRDRSDLERAVAVARDCDVGAGAAPLVLNAVAYVMARAGTDFRRPELVARAVKLGERALRGLSGGANEAMALENLGTYYRAVEFLDGSASPTGVGLDAGGLDDRGLCEGGLAGGAGRRSRSSDRYRAVWHRAAVNSQAPAWYRLSAARRWAESAYPGLPADESSLDAYRLALDLVTSVATVGIDRPSREAQLRDLSAIARDSAAAALQAGRPVDALYALECGRAVLWSEPVEAQRLAAALEEVAPSLARRVAMVGAGLWLRGNLPEGPDPRLDDELGHELHSGPALRATYVTSNGGHSAAPTARMRTVAGTDEDDLAVGKHARVDSGPDDAATGSGREPPERSLTGEPPANRTQGPADGGVRAAWASEPEPDPVDRRLALAREWDDLLAEVRALPGFETFLQPPSYADLLRAAAHGPVVTVNVSEWRCDALFLTSAGVEAVPLPALSLRDAERRLEQHLTALAAFDQAVAEFEEADLVLQLDHTDGDAIRLRQEAGIRRREATLALDDELTGLVGWLWDVVVLPILDKLPPPGPDGLRPRIWWCPTGPLAFLPLHAAGRGSQWLHDMVVSSTTPTVRSLLDARSDLGAGPRDAASTGRGAEAGTSTEQDSGRDTGGAGRRRFLVASTFGSTDGLLAGPLSRLTATDLVECSDVAGVRRHLETCDFVHFDCHGDQVLTDPSQGGVRLTDGVLRVFDVSVISATGEFAGLAACKTAVGGVHLLDEAITLSAALHYAGFRHVVGTLWNLAETVAQSAFAGMYDRLVTDDGAFDPTDAARALAASVDQLRADGERLHSWASLVHIGP